MEINIVRAGKSSLRGYHEFMIDIDPAIGEVFVKCVCDWQTSHYGVAGSLGDLVVLLEKDILDHNDSSGGALGSAE